MSDWLDATEDPRVVAVVLARLQLASRLRPELQGDYLGGDLRRIGIKTNSRQARALLDAVAAWDDLNGKWRATRSGTVGVQADRARDEVVADVYEIVEEQA